MNIFPEKIVRTRSSSSGYFSEIFSLDAWVNLGLLGFFIALFFFVAASPLIGSIFLILMCIDIDQYEKPIWLNIIGMLVSLYLLIDIHKGWFMSYALSMIFDNAEMYKVVCINAASLVANLIVLIFAEPLFELALKNKFVVFVYFSVILFLLYLISNSVFDEKFIKILN